MAACFFVNAVFWAGLVPRLPAVKARLGLSSTALGTALAAVPLGALVAGFFAAALVRRLGSGRVASYGLVLLGLAVWGVAAAPGWAGLATVLLLVGAADAVVDVAQNAHALRVQRRYGRSILNSFHGLWSVGAVAGGLLGSAAAGAGLPLTAHLGASAVVFGAVALAASRAVLPGRDEAAQEDAAATDGGLRLLVASLGALGVLAGCGALVEDAGSSWSALYLSSELDAGPALAGLGFVALSAAMTLGRLLGDRVVDRFGQQGVARAGGALVAAGMGLALALPSVPAALVGFGCAGLGVATLVPAVYHAADERPGLPPGRGLAAVNWLLRVGFLVSPPVVGAVADATSLRVALLGVVLAGAGTVALGGALPRRPVRRPI